MYWYLAPLVSFPSSLPLRSALSHSSPTTPKPRPPQKFQEQPAKPAIRRHRWQGFKGGRGEEWRGLDKNLGGIYLFNVDDF